MIGTLRMGLKGLTALKDLETTQVMGKVLNLLTALEGKDEDGALEAYTGLYHQVASQGYDDLGAWVRDQLRYGESLFARRVALGRETAVLETAARHDVAILTQLATLTPMNMMCPGWSTAMQSTWNRLPSLTGEVGYTVEEMMADYRTYGTGQFARYRAFFWTNGALVPVEKPDCPVVDGLWGYSRQRDQVIANTKAFVAGNRVNDVLLYGDSGTGKSATVKAQLTLPGMESLRLIEVQKTGLADLAGLMRDLSRQPQKFILFIDDLAFDEDDNTYSLVKSILEGGLEPRPNNVVIYATSNRRLLVRQTFSDRAGDEVDMQETIQEKTALSDRFGLRIPYLGLTKKEFLQLVAVLAQKAGVDMAPEEIREQAVQWDMRFPGRTPRGAKQFVASLRR